MVCVLSYMVSVMVRAGGLMLRWVNARMRGPVCGAWSRVCGAVGCAFPQPASPRAQRMRTTKSPKRALRGLLVAPTGVDPVTFRFSVERSTN